MDICLLFALFSFLGLACVFGLICLILAAVLQCFASWHFIFQQVEEQYEVLCEKYPPKLTSYHPLAIFLYI